MKKNTIRILSGLLTLVMLLGAIPFASAACADGCVDSNADTICDSCGEAITATPVDPETPSDETPETPEEDPDTPVEPESCQHTETTTSYIPTNDGMHTIEVTCNAVDCGKIISKDAKLCTDVNNDNECDNCHAEIPDDAELCEHTDVTTIVDPAGNGKHIAKAVCTNPDCGATLAQVTYDCADEDGDDLCDRCGDQMIVSSNYSISCPQDRTETSSHSLNLSFALLGADTTDVSWTFSATGSSDPELSNSTGSGSETSVTVSTNNGRGVAKVTATATWDGGQVSKTVNVSFYDRTSVTVYVKDGQKSFYFTQNKIFTQISGVRNDRVDNYSLYNFMTDGCATRITLHENRKSNKDVGYVTCKTSGQFYQYDPDDYNDYNIADLRNIYFNIINEGSFKLNFELYEMAGSLGLTTTSGTVTIVVGDPGTEDVDIVYRTNGDPVVFDSDDFDQYWNEHSGSKTEKLSYVKFSIDDRAYGALYLDKSQRGLVSSNYKFIPNYSKSAAGTYDLDDVTYVPNPNMETYTEDVDFIAYGKAGNILKGSVTVIVGEQMAFTDVSTSDWFYKNVRYVLDEGIMNGISDTKFSPNGTLTRGMVVTMLYRVEGSPKVSGKSSFTDVPSGQWYADAIQWASSNGIVEGMGNGKFAPDTAITREQLATILYRYAKSEKLSTSYGSTNLSDFKDENKVSSYATDAMKWAVYMKIMQGSNSYLNPKNTATRAEAAAMFQRFLENDK